MSEQTVAQLLKTPTKPADIGQSFPIQRRCACGQHTVAGGECESCRKKRLKQQHRSRGNAKPLFLSEQQGLSAPSGAAAWPQPRFRHDFSRVQLRTRQHLVQRQPQGAEAMTAAPMAEPANQSLTETPPETAEATPTAEPATPGETAVPSLIVEDGTTKLDDGQMRKSEFMAELHTAVCAAANAELAATGRDTEGCPYLDYWFDFYGQRDVVHGERALRRYAPEAANATSARDYIPIVAERVRQGVTRWARTGEVSGVPDGVPTTVPGEPPAETSGSVQFKAREGGARQADDPAAIRDQLGHGRPLDSRVRSRMEPVFGTSFSHVRMHDDSRAATLSSDLNARAFTVGEQVAFAAGEYQPGTLLGDALIAHELAHVVQQSSANESVANMQVGDTGYDALEKDADRTAVGVLASLWQNTTERATNFAQTALPLLRSGIQLQRCCYDDQGTRFTQMYKQYGGSGFERVPYCACRPKQHQCVPERADYPKKDDGSSWPGLEIEYEVGCMSCSKKSERHLSSSPCEETVGCR